MTDVAATTESPAGGRGRARLLGPGWPFFALFAAYPVWWILGLGELIWPLMAIPMAIELARKPRLLAPRGFLLYALFLCVVLVSATMLEESADLIGWAVRFSQYLGIGVLILYLANAGDWLTKAAIVRTMTWMWMAAVVGGYLGLVLGDVSFTSPMAILLPGNITGNELVNEVVYPGLADVDRFLGYSINRPKAPFTYTNGWGAAFALLTPFALAASRNDVGMNRRFVNVMLVAAVVPAVMSVNRGLWLSLGLGVGYGLIHLAGRGDRRALLTLVASLAAVIVLLLVTPLGDVVNDRINTPHSDEDRLDLYEQVLDELGDSPVVGFGGPRPVSEGGPPLGTHGQLWIVLFSYGFLGAFLYFAFMGRMLVQISRPRTELGLWALVVMLIGLIQVFFYGHVPQQLSIIVVAIALGQLDRAGGRQD